jgi:hypothetical protein
MSELGTKLILNIYNYIILIYFFILGSKRSTKMSLLRIAFAAILEGASCRLTHEKNFFLLFYYAVIVVIIFHTQFCFSVIIEAFFGFQIFCNYQRNTR